MTTPDEVRSLLTNPSESLAVELKDWIDPESNEGIAKIVRACIALRNNNGGYLIIGVRNDGVPNAKGVLENVDEAFHIDAIQAIVSKYASESFEIEVYFAEHQGERYPVIKVPSGVRTPVAAKRDLLDGNGPALVRTNRVYVRSLRANNVPSTAEANWGDWPSLIETCFDNREADIGRFLRRHLGGVDGGVLKELLNSVMETFSERDGTGVSSPHEVLALGAGRYIETAKARKITLPSLGTWEVAAVIEGDVPEHHANQEFLRLIFSSNPRLTGWPVWLDLSGMSVHSNPQVFDEGWEAILCGQSEREDLDFWRIEPRGAFYMLRALQDDIESRSPGRVLEFALAILRAAEAISAVLRFARAMGCDPDSSHVRYAFRWNDLYDRVLSAWANPRRMLTQRRTAGQDSVTSEVTVPLGTPDSALGDFVYRATAPLFRVFEGMEFSSDVVTDLTDRLLSRKL